MVGLARRPAPGMVAGRQYPCGECLDAVDHLLKADGVEQVEGVLGGGQLGVDDRAGRDRAQRVREARGRGGGQQRVAGAVRDEERGCVGTGICARC